MTFLYSEGYFAFCLRGNTPRVTSLGEVSHLQSGRSTWVSSNIILEGIKRKNKIINRDFSLGKFRGKMDKIIFRKGKIIRSEFIMF